MDNTDQKALVNICSKMTQIEADLKAVLHKIFTQSDENLQSETQEKYNQEIAMVKQVFVKFKTTYGCMANLRKN